MVLMTSGQMDYKLCTDEEVQAHGGAASSTSPHCNGAHIYDLCLAEKKSEVVHCLNRLTLRHPELPTPANVQRGLLTRARTGRGGEREGTER